MRRRRKDTTEPEVEETAATPADPAEAVGPYDVADHPLQEDDPSRIDLGALSIAGHPDLEVRLQVDEASGAVVASVAGALPPMEGGEERGPPPQPTLAGGTPATEEGATAPTAGEPPERTPPVSEAPTPRAADPRPSDDAHRPLHQRVPA